MRDSRVIPTHRLRLEQVPAEGDSLRNIWAFALTFDPRKMGEYAQRASDLDNVHALELRSHLYVEQKRWNNYCREPDADSEAQLRRIIGLLRLGVNSST